MTLTFRRKDIHKNVLPAFPVVDWYALEWQITGPDENPESRMLARIDIGPLAMHLEAYEVTRDDEGILRTVAWSEDMDKTYEGLMSEGEWQTIKIEGREYILIAQPFGA